MIGIRAKRRVRLHRRDDLQPGDVRQLDVHHDHVGRERTRAIQRVAAVAHRLHLVAVHLQQVAEQLQIEFVVLDNEHLARQIRQSPSALEPLYAMKATDTNRPDPHALALGALGWTLDDPARAERLLAVTGLDAAGLRARAADPALLAAVLGFLAAHEADLVACADALGIGPDALVAAQARLEGAA